MADVKWIKITTSIFDDEKIKVIDSLPERDAIFVIWIKLLTLAGKCNGGGLVYLSETVPYTDEMLAAIFNRPVNVVRLALDIFRKFGMIDIFQDQKILIVNWEKHQNVESLEKIHQQTARRVASFRARKRLESCNVTCNATVTQGNAIDIDIDIDKDIDKDQNKSVHPVEDEPAAPRPHSPPKRFVKPPLEEVRAYCAERRNTVSPEKFLDYYEANGWRVGRNPMKDWRAAVRNWEQNEKVGGKNASRPSGRKDPWDEPGYYENGGMREARGV